MKLQRLGFQYTILLSLSIKNKAWSRRLLNHDEVPCQLQPQLPGGCKNFVTSGFDIASSSSVTFYTSTTYINLAQSGTYIGTSNIFEHVSYASDSSPFIEKEEILLRIPKFVGFAPDPKTQNSIDLCQFTIVFSA
ncbi:hypothetical protein ACA910_007401 [Epithemia clementina (nom. ined.)]